jgi:hypothetical protein
VSQPNDHERNCRFANNLVATAQANLVRAVGFALHAAADCPDHDISNEQVKLAAELRKTHRRLAHIHFTPGDEPETKALKEVA